MVDLEAGNWLDDGDAWLRALTRLRRSQTKRAPPEPVVYSAAPAYYAVYVPDGVTGNARRDLLAPNVEARLAWRTAQWDAGNRRCGYCRVRMTCQSNLPRTRTVDHRIALGRGGLDVEANWILACLRCNNRKDLMSEASFRALLAREV